MASSASADVIYEFTGTFAGTSGLQTKTIDARFQLVDYQTLRITIINNAANPTSDADGISGLQFRLNNATVTGMTSAMGTQIHIPSKTAAFTYPYGNTPTSLTHWQDVISNPNSTTSDNNLNLFTGGGAYQVILGGPDPANPTKYTNANNSILNHDPSVKESATFTLSITRPANGGAISITDFLSGNNSVTYNWGTMTGQTKTAAYKSGTLSIAPTLAISATPTCTNFIAGHVGTVTVKVGNTSPAGPNSDAANFTLSGTGGVSNLPGTPQTRAAGDANAAAGSSFTANYTSQTVGPNQTFTVTATDGNASNSPQTASFTANVYNHATIGSFNGGAIDVGRMHVGYNAFTAGQTVSVTNGASTDYRVNLKGSAPSSGGITLSSISGLTPGSTGTISASVAAGLQAGPINQPMTYTFADDSTICGVSSDLAHPTINVTGSVYSGLSIWGGNASSNWNNFSNWDTLGGVPGIDGSLSRGHDTATFGSAGLGRTTVYLNGTSPEITSMTFQSGGSYTIAQGTGGTIQLSGSSASITAAGTHTISAPVALNSNTQVSVTGSSDVLTMSGGISGLSGLTKTGSGTLTLSGSSNYSGATAVNNGTLQLNGSLGNTAVTIATGARLQGINGTASGTVAVNGTIAPGQGASVSTLSTGAETWSRTGTYEVDIASATSNQSVTLSDADRVIMSSLNLTTGFTVKALPTSGSPSNFSPGVDNPIYNWVIGQLGSGTFDVSKLVLDTSAFTGPNTQPYHFSLLAVDDTVIRGSSGTPGVKDLVLRYTYSAVPEATTLLLGIAGLSPLLLQRRRARLSTSTEAEADNA